jgi:formylglycine-generating enzyme required for sulfatase activity
MKTTFTHFFALSVLLALPSCSKKPVEVTGQIFVITQGRENIKMGGVEVLVVPDEEFRKKAKEVVTWMQQEAKAEAQRKVDSDHMTDLINEAIELEKTSPLKIPELPKIRESIVKESDAASKILNSVLAGDLKARALRMLLGGNEKMEFTTDADGKFIAPIMGKAWFFAAAARKVGDETEDYLWVKGFEAPKGVSKVSLVISNDDDINDEDELYSILEGACEVQGQLENFRNVEVSEKMKSLVWRHREDVESAKNKAEKDAAEAKAKAEREVAEAKVKAEAAYQKFRGQRAGEERVMEIAPGVSMTFCWCPAGDFMMGIPSSEADRVSNEEQVKVTLSKGFWMGKTEVTQAQWLAVMGSNPSNFKGTNLPMESLSWNDAQEFLKKIDPVLAARDRWKTMLPTEAQWEYAARAGESWIYSGGDNLDEVAWHDDNSRSTTNPVGMKKPNAWGMHDMSGNVREWCRDWYDEKLAGGLDPAGASSGTARVVRGGSWFINAYDCRVAVRSLNYPSASYNDFGFRVVRSAAP